MNSVQIMGRLTKDPDLQFTQSGTAVVKFTVAVNRMKKDDPADFIRCVAFNKNAENIANYFVKGSMIAIQGRIQTGSYDDKDGKKVYTTDVIVDRFHFCGGKNEGGSSNGGGYSSSAYGGDGYTHIGDTDDDGEIPF